MSPAASSLEDCFKPDIKDLAAFVRVQGNLLLTVVKSTQPAPLQEYFSLGIK